MYIERSPLDPPRLPVLATGGPPGRRGPGGAAGAVGDDRRRPAREGAAGRLSPVRRGAARLPPGREHQVDSLQAELSFYAQVLGFETPPEESVPVLEIENLHGTKRDAHDRGEQPRPRSDATGRAPSTGPGCSVDDLRSRPTSPSSSGARSGRSSTRRVGRTSQAGPARDGRCATTARRSTDGRSCRGWRTAITRRDLSVDLLGTRLSSPILLAPVGAGQLIDPDCDLHVARAAAAGRCAVRVHQPGRHPDGGMRGRDGRCAAMGAALLEHRRGARRQPDPAGRGDRRGSSRGHPRHHHARLAAAGPQPRFASVRAGPRHRSVHLRPALPRARPRAHRRCRRRPASSRRWRSPSGRSGRCSRSPATIRARSWRTSVHPSRVRRWRRSSTSTPTRH